MTDLQNPSYAHLFLLIQKSPVYKAFTTHHTLLNRLVNLTCQATCQSKNTDKLSLIGLLPVFSSSYWKCKWEWNDLQRI